MDILVKGMEMPTGCSPLTLKVWPDGQVEIIDADEEWKASEVIPVPPHGRLIDADVLTRSQGFHGFIYENGLAYVEVGEVVDLINAAPTVISASEEGKT